MQLGQLEERDRELPNDLSQPLPYCDANYLNRKGLTRGGSSMGAARLRQTSSRMSKARRRLSKRSGTSRPETMNDDESTQAEEIDRLLLSSLRYWEVERDLIEERMGAIGR